MQWLKQATLESATKIGISAFFNNSLNMDDMLQKIKILSADKIKKLN